MNPALMVIARIARTDAARLSPEVTLDRLGLGTSLGLSILQSSLERRFNCKLGQLSWQTTVGELLAAVEGESLPVPMEGIAAKKTAAGPRRASGPFSGRRHASPGAGLPRSLGHGVDIQEIAAVPPENDAAAGSFYETHFTPEEIAGSGTKADPRAHLCGLWCAKEAVRKADDELQALAFSEIVIEPTMTGRPTVRIARPELAERFEVALSISHSAAYAVASAIVWRR